MQIFLAWLFAEKQIWVEGLEVLCNFWLERGQSQASKERAISTTVTAFSLRKIAFLQHIKKLHGF